MFKSIRYVYDRNGIETERQIEILKRDKESSRTIYFFKERLKDNPHILKIIQNSRKTKERGIVSYYDIRQSRHIEDLDETQGEKIEEKVQEVVDFVALGEYIDQPVRTYSSGMKAARFTNSI